MFDIWKYLLLLLVTISKGFSKKQSKSCRSIDLETLDINKIFNLYANYNVTVQGLVQCYLDRINKFNPYLNAVIQTNPDALQIAFRLDLKKPREFLTLPLFGIPVLIQDNIATLDKMPTTGGSMALLKMTPRYEAELVKKLRKAGAVILGKTNLSEFSGMRFGKLKQGYSQRGFQTINPFNKTWEVYGASTGAAVAVAASFAIAAIGNSLDGSLSGPSSAVSLYGYSPSYHSNFSHGLIPDLPLDKMGIITKSYDDLVIISDTLKLGLFQNENIILSSRSKLNIGMLREPYFFHPRVQNQNFDILYKIQSDQIQFTDVAIKISPDFILKRLLVQFKARLEDYLKQNAEDDYDIRPTLLLGDIVKYNQAYYQPNTNESSLFELTQDLEPNTQETYQSFILMQFYLQEAFQTLMKENNLDLLMVPSQPETNSQLLASLLRLPTMTIPINQTATGNYGVTIISNVNDDAKLFAVTKLLEPHLMKFKLNFKRSNHH